jgi:hypothetical protein
MSMKDVGQKPMQISASEGLCFHAMSMKNAESMFWKKTNSRGVVAVSVDV